MLKEPKTTNSIGLFTKIKIAWTTTLYIVCAISLYGHYLLYKGASYSVPLDSPPIAQTASYNNLPDAKEQVKQKHKTDMCDVVACGN